MTQIEKAIKEQAEALAKLRIKLMKSAKWTEAHKVADELAKLSNDIKEVVDDRFKMMRGKECGLRIGEKVFHKNRQGETVDECTYQGPGQWEYRGKMYGSPSETASLSASRLSGIKGRRENGWHYWVRKNGEPLEKREYDVERSTSFIEEHTG